MTSAETELAWRDWRDRHGITVALPVADPREFRGAFISGYEAGAAAERERISNDYHPGRWWRVLDPDGSVWCETSDEREARESMRPGDALFRLFVLDRREWRSADLLDGAP